MDDFDERVRQHAHRLWVEEGCPEGRAEAHWDKARELVALEQNQKQTTKPVVGEAKQTREPVEPTPAMSKAAPRPAGKAMPAKKAAAPRAAAVRQASGAKSSEPKGKSPRPH